MDETNLIPDRIAATLRQFPPFSMLPPETITDLAQSAHVRVLVAGDTMNDLSMLRLGLPAVAVGGSEAALIERMEPLEHAHVAKGIGVAGIAEAIAHHNLFPNS